MIAQRSAESTGVLETLLDNRSDPHTRTVLRDFQLDGLTKLASDGPGKRGYSVTEHDKTTEELHRLLIRRSLPANTKAWAEHCPKPEGWEEAAQ